VAAVAPKSASRGRAVEGVGLRHAGDVEGVLDQALDSRVRQVVGRSAPGSSLHEDPKAGPSGSRLLDPLHFALPHPNAQVTALGDDDLRHVGPWAGQIQEVAGALKEPLGFVHGRQTPTSPPRVKESPARSWKNSGRASDPEGWTRETLANSRRRL